MKLATVTIVVAYASLLFVLAMVSNAAGTSEPEALDRSSRGQCRAALGRAFELRFDQSTAEDVIVTRSYGTDSEEIRIHSARKLIKGRMHSVVRFLGPAEYRGWRMLTIENPDRSDDHFIFMRSIKRVKRVRAEPADSFFATDFALEDMERRSIVDYEILDCAASKHDGEPSWQISARPTYDSSYARSEFTVSTDDFAQLLVRHYRRGSDVAAKEISSPRSHILEIDGIPVARKIIVRSRGGRTETTAEVLRIVLNPGLPNSLFSKTALEVDREIPGL